MKINVKFLTAHLVTCLFMVVPFAKAQPSPACISQCEAFCSAVVANFASNGMGPLSTGPLSNQTLLSLINVLPEGSLVQSDVSLFQGYTGQMTSDLNTFPYLSPVLTNCQQPNAYCSQVCTPPAPPPAKSIAQKPTLGRKMTAPAK